MPDERPTEYEFEIDPEAVPCGPQAASGWWGLLLELVSSVAAQSRGGAQWPVLRQLRLFEPFLGPADSSLTVRLFESTGGFDVWSTERAPAGTPEERRTVLHASGRIGGPAPDAADSGAAPWLRTSTTAEGLASATGAALQMAFLAGCEASDGRSDELVYIDEVTIAAEAEQASVAFLGVRAARGRGRAFDVIARGADGGTLVCIVGARLASARQSASRRLRWFAAQVAACLRDVTGEHVELDQRLLDLGLSSIATVRFRESLLDSMIWAPPLESLLASPTVLEVAALYAEGGRGGWEPPPFIETRPADTSAELSYAEQRLWFLEEHAAVAPTYNEVAGWRLPRRIDPARLRDAVAKLVRRHEALRTSYPSSGGLPQRRVTPPAASVAPPLLVLADGEGQPEDATASELHAAIVAPFDLKVGPLCRIILVRRRASDELILVAHHIVGDGWSLRRVIRRELAGLLQGDDPGPEPPRMSSFAAWERRHVTDRYLDAHLGFWRSWLQHTPFGVPVASEETHATRTSHAGRRVPLSVSVSAADVDHVARQHQVTRFAVFLTAFQLAIFRHARQPRFACGIPVSLRDTRALDGLVGCLVNTVPFAAEVSAGADLGELLTATQQRLALALSHGRVPFEQIVRHALPADAGKTRSPLQLAFSYDESDQGPDSVLGQPLEFDTGSSKFQLMIEVRVHGGVIGGAVEFRTELFSTARAERIARHFAHALRRLVVDPSVLVDGEWFMTPADRVELDVWGRGPEVQLPALPAHLRILRGPLASGSVSCAGTTREAGEVASRARRIASALCERLDPEDRIVAVCTGRSLAWPEAVLAVLTAGRAYLPIDPDVPLLRALASLREAGATTLLYDADRCSWVDDFQGRAFELSELASAGADVEPACDPGGADPAYSIATSGSTGVPKVALLPHRGLSNLVGWYAELLDLGPGDCVLVATSVGFDLTQKNLFVALGSGASLELYPQGPFDDRAVLELIATRRATVLNCTPSMFEPLVRQARQTSYRELVSLRWLVLGGETVDLEPLRDWLLHPSCNCRVVNSYGPAECCDVVAAHVLTEAELADGLRTVPIGSPVPNTQLAVCDESGKLLPAGAIGELTITGAGVGHGYLGSTPGSGGFTTDAMGRRCYRTGDLVRLDDAGRLLFLGRRDTQVKIRGHRVEVADVESVLRSNPALDAVAVIALAGPPRASGLAAFWVATQEVTVPALRLWAAARLPSAMVPMAFVRVDALPLGSNGKVDRQALMALYAAPERAAVCSTRPRNADERVLLEIWRELLPLAPSGIDDDFFELGGHSLLAIQLVEQVEARLSAVLRVADVFAYPSVRLMSEFLGSSAR